MTTLNFLVSISLVILSILVLSNIVNIQACTPYENCVRTLPHTTVQTASFNGNHMTYGIPYTLSNGTLVASFLDLPAKELFFIINATDDGKLTVELPRQTIDSTRDGKDKPYLVFVETWNATKRVMTSEIQNDNQTRTLIIDFTKGNNRIGIVGTYFIENNSTTIMHNGYGAWSPLQQYKKGFDAQDIICKQGFQLIFKSEGGFPACVHTQTTFNLVERGWGLVSNSMKETMNVDNTKFAANYTITYGQISDIKMDVQTRAIIVTMQSNGSGNLIIQIPQDLVKSSNNNLHYAGLIVLNDGQESSYKEIKTIPGKTTLLIPFVNGIRQIDIIPSYY